ncbi:hypothetical protein SAMN04490220_8952 [Rhodococcus jostii]|uniref:Uncharacterized protein n=1 Tax=Rhodococcus jostii TaxID=132919 RepID=A0A1H5MHP5_RHOJO|nr:hypothetical protein SAMN04490220_8952 [Rhodococcus jostii]
MRCRRWCRCGGGCRRTVLHHDVVGGCRLRSCRLPHTLKSKSGRERAAEAPGIQSRTPSLTRNNRAIRRTVPCHFDGHIRHRRIAGRLDRLAWFPVADPQSELHYASAKTMRVAMTAGIRLARHGPSGAPAPKDPGRRGCGTRPPSPTRPAGGVSALSTSSSALRTPRMPVTVAATAGACLRSRCVWSWRDPSLWDEIPTCSRRSGRARNLMRSCARVRRWGE